MPPREYRRKVSLARWFTALTSTKTVAQIWFAYWNVSLKVRVFPSSVSHCRMVMRGENTLILMSTEATGEEKERGLSGTNAMAWSTVFLVSMTLEPSIPCDDVGVDLSVVYRIDASLFSVNNDTLTNSRYSPSVNCTGSKTEDV